MEELTIFAIFFAFMIPGVIALTLYDRKQNRARSRRLSARPKPTTEQWCAQYCDPQNLDPIIAQKVTAALAKILGCAPTQILPTDSFQNQLALKPGQSKFRSIRDHAILNFETKGLRPLLGDPGLYRYQNHKQKNETIADIIQWIQAYEFSNATELQDNLLNPSSPTLSKGTYLQRVKSSCRKVKSGASDVVISLFLFLGIKIWVFLIYTASMIEISGWHDWLYMALVLVIGGPLILWGYWYWPFHLIRKMHRQELPVHNFIRPMFTFVSLCPSLVIIAVALMILTPSAEDAPTQSSILKLELLLAALLITTGNFFVTRKMRRYAKLDPLELKKCPTCKYNLQNLPERGCPECGWYRQPKKKN